MLQSDPKPYRGLWEVLTVAAPACVSMLNNTLMQFVDGLMVARVQPHVLAGQFAAGITSFIATCFCIGILSLVNTFVAQNFGAGKLKRCGAFLWAGLVLAVLLGAGESLLAIPAKLIFQLYGHSADLQAMEVMYFRYMTCGAVFFLVGHVAQQFLYGLGRSNTVLKCSLAANVVNFCLNYVLIYGKFGLPAMGLQGAAIGTVSASIFLCAVLLAVVMSQSWNEKYGTRNFRAFRWADVQQLIRRGWASGLHFANDIFTWSIMSNILIERFGEDHLTANSAIVRYLSLSFMPLIGVNIATTALVGKYIGMKRPDLARRRAHVAMGLAVAYASVLGIVFYVFRVELLHLMFRENENTSAETIEAIVTIGSRLMVCVLVFQVFDAIAIIANGALRGAGETVWPMLISFLLTWTVLVGGGVAMVTFLPKLTSLGPWIAATVYLVLTGTLFLWRFEAGKWQKIKLVTE